MGLGMAGVGVVGHAQVQIPLVQVLAEAETHRSARRYAEVAALLDRVLARVAQGERLPEGVDRDRLHLAAATAHVRTGGFTRASALAKGVVSATKVKLLQSEARFVWGLALALDQKFAEAVPVFGDLALDPNHRDRAWLYQGIAAREAGLTEVAIAAYERVLAQAPQDGDWADAALALVSLQLQRGQLAEVERGLVRLRDRPEAVDNVVGLALLTLQAGDAALTAEDAIAALAAYQSVPSRVELVRLHEERDRRLETQIAGLRALSGAGAADSDAVRRLELRRAQAKQALAELNRSGDFDASVLLRRGRAFQARGQVWEAALVLGRLVERHPAAAEREGAFATLVRAYAESGRLDRTLEAAQRLIEAYPKSELSAQALAVAAQAAGERGNRAEQLRFLELALEGSSPPELRETLLLLHANALFAAGRHEAARTASERSLEAFPEGRFVEDAVYLRTMAGFVMGKQERALEELAAYLTRFPGGRFVADARYRVAAAEFALERYEPASVSVKAWLEAHPADHAQRGEVLSLQGDVLAARSLHDEAIAAYESALGHPLSDDGRGYILDELTRIQLARREFEPAARRWEEFAERNPDHAFTVNAAYWIGRIRTQAGDRAAALASMAAVARRHLADPRKEDVERLLLELARVASGAVPDGSGASVGSAEAWLLTPELRSVPTARARAWFVDAEVAALRRDEARRDALLEQIARTCSPDLLPAGLLGRLGDHRRAAGDPEQARLYYTALVATAPRSLFADFAYVGLGELALDRGDPSEALAQFEAAIDLAGARFKLLEATLGRARSLFALERWTEAKTLFEQISSNRAWRGEATARSVFALGEILARGDDPDALAKAQGFYQRVYLGYRKFAPWVARAYLRSGETFERLGQTTEALATYRELLRDSRLSASAEAETARRHLARLEGEGRST